MEEKEVEEKEVVEKKRRVAFSTSKEKVTKYNSIILTLLMSRWRTR